MAEKRKIEKSIDVPERQRIAWKREGGFTKNPDMIELPSGKLMFTYNDTDYHWPTKYSRVAVVESGDGGKTWGNLQILSESFPEKGEERWVTPRMSLLSDGRIVVICDQNDFRHCHESQEPGIYAWWSADEGKTWSGVQPTGIPGIEPDRVRETEDGVLVITAHYMFKKTHKLGQFLMKSYDGGNTWTDFTVIASDPVHNYCEGNILFLQSGRWVCIMRENNHRNYPSYLSFSEDRGRNWSKPVMAPFSGDRPFAEQWEDGRTLVTFRNQAGVPGLYAWLGDIEKETGYKVSKSGVMVSHTAVMGQSDGYKETDNHPERAVALGSEALKLTAVKDAFCKYLLLPPESSFSNVIFEAELKAEGKDGEEALVLLLARIGVHLVVTPDAIYHKNGRAVDLRRQVDMRRWRKLRIEYIDGKAEYYIDGVSIMRQLIYSDSPFEQSYIGNTQDSRGACEIRNIRYSIENPTDGFYRWEWEARSGEYPDQYAIDRWLQVDYNSNIRPDHGYSTFIPKGNGEFLVLDYSNDGEASGLACIKAYQLRLSDFEG